MKKRPATRLKIGLKLNIVYVLALLIPLTVAGIALISSARQTLEDYYIQLLETDNRRVRTLLTEVTVQAYDISDEVCFDNTLKNALMGTYSSNSEFLAAVNGYNDLALLNYNSLEVANIYIYTDNPTIVDYKQFRRVTDEIAGADWYQKSKTVKNAFWVSIAQKGFSGVQNNLCLVRQVSLFNSDYHAVAVVCVSDTYLRARLDSGSIIDAVSIDGQGIVYSSLTDMYGKEQPVAINYSDPYYRSSGIVTVDEEPYFSAVSTINLHMTSSKMRVCTLDETGFTAIQRVMVTWVLILLVALLVPLLIILLFSGRFVRRINLLRSEMHKASQQDYNIRTEFGGSDELSDAFEDLKSMVLDIKEKDAKMYEAELNEKELRNTQQLMEYKMLCSQINPHYLYNTLETIRMKSLTSGNREVADAIKILGKTLHYVLENNGNTLTTLDKELDHAKNYLSIQRLRFGERINYSVDISQEIDSKHYTMLPLLLQPVVENAVIHGLETATGNGVITISAQLDDGGMCLSVSDNGSGIGEADLEAIRLALEAATPPESGIALYNIHRRLRLFYGENYGVLVESILGIGTRVILRLPSQE